MDIRSLRVFNFVLAPPRHWVINGFYRALTKSDSWSRQRSNAGCPSPMQFLPSVPWPAGLAILSGRSAWLGSDVRSRRRASSPHEGSFPASNHPIPTCCTLLAPKAAPVRGLIGPLLRASGSRVARIHPAYGGNLHHGPRTSAAKTASPPNEFSSGSE